MTESCGPIRRTARLCGLIFGEQRNQPVSIVLGPDINDLLEHMTNRRLFFLFE